MPENVKATNTPPMGRHYLRQTKQHDLLESSEEFVLVKRWRESADREALHRLVSSHLRLVAKIAHGYRGYGLPTADLISEGNVGMMQALHRFDPQKGFRLSTYAMWWVKAQINQFILNSWSLVKIGTTPQQRKLFFNLRKLKAKMGVSEQVDLDDESKKHISEVLNVSENEVMEMNQRLSRPDHSLNVPISKNGEGDGEWQDLMADDETDHEEQFMYQNELEKRRQILEESMEVLSPREHDIFKRRRLQEPPETLEILSQDLRISRERVRQIEFKVFEKLQKAIQTHPVVQKDMLGNRQDLR